MAVTVSVRRSVIPDGTAVGAYKLTQIDHRRRIAKAPTTTADASGTLSGGSVSLSGLTDGVMYALYGDVSGTARYVIFQGAP